MSGFAFRAVLAALLVLAHMQGALADEPGSGSRARSVPLEKRRVVARAAPAAPLWLVPPCEENFFFAPLLRCIPVATLVEPTDLAVRNAVHGAPYRTRKPYATLFDW